MNISVIQYIGDNGASSLLPGTGAETVGLMAYDEPPTYQQGVVTPLSTTPNSVQDGRFWWMNIAPTMRKRSFMIFAVPCGLASAPRRSRVGLPLTIWGRMLDQHVGRQHNSWTETYQLFRA